MRVSKLNIIAFALTLSAAAPSPAEGLWDDHVKPTLKEGTSNRSLLILATGGLLTGASQSYDYDNRAAYSQNQKIPQQTSKFGDLLGTGIPGALTALAQLKWDNENGWSHAEALVYTGVTTAILKQSFARARPASENHHSMPSGHTSTTFASATALAYAYGWWAAVPAYALATFTAATRWSDDAHWLSDTVAGATIGIYWGRAASIHHAKNEETTLLPYPIKGGAGLVWMRFF